MQHSFFEQGFGREKNRKWLPGGRGVYVHEDANWEPEVKIFSGRLLDTFPVLFPDRRLSI